MKKKQWKHWKNCISKKDKIRGMPKVHPFLFHIKKGSKVA